MATYNLTIALTNPGSSTTQNLASGDTLNLTATLPSGRATTNPEVFSSPTNCSVSPSSDTTSPYNFTVTSFTSSSYSVVISFVDGDGNTTSYQHTVSGTVSSGSSYTAPVISSVTNDGAAAANVTATVNLSSNGSGGTLQYAQTTSNSVPASGWQSSNQFSHPRGTTRYYWASQATNTSGAYSSSVYHAVSFISPDTSVSATSSTITVSATSAGTTLSNATSGETYAVRINNGSTNLGTRSGNGVITWTSSLPSSGSTTTYEIFALRPTSIGGSGSYVATNDTFTVTRDSGASTTYSINAPASINEGSAGTVTVSTTGFGSGTLYWSVSPSGQFNTSTGSVSISSNSGSFSVTPTADSTTEGAESASVSLFTDSARTNQVATDNFTINDTSTTPAGSSTFGVQVFNASGTKLLDVTDTLERFVQSGTVTVAMNNGTTDVTVSGMTNTDSWTVLVIPQNTNNLGSLYSVRTAKGTNKFTVTNSTSGSGSTTYDYWVLTT